LRVLDAGPVLCHDARLVRAVVEHDVILGHVSTLRRIQRASLGDCPVPRVIALHPQSLTYPVRWRTREPQCRIPQ
jgi:hypothetical protein